MYSCQPKNYGDYLSQNKVITITGRCSLVGSLPFAELTVTPKAGFPVYLSFKYAPHLREEIQKYHISKDLRVTGRTLALHLTTADQKHTVVQYVMILEKYEVISPQQH